MHHLFFANHAMEKSICCMYAMNWTVCLMGTCSFTSIFIILKSYIFIMYIYFFIDRTYNQDFQYTLLVCSLPCKVYIILLYVFHSFLYSLLQIWLLISLMHFCIMFAHTELSMDCKNRKTTPKMIEIFSLCVWSFSVNFGCNTNFS